MNNTGGPAFPYLETGDCGQREGMTLRDYFAAKAMQSISADNTYVERTETAFDWLKIVAMSSYEMADAMLKAREE